MRVRMKTLGAGPEGLWPPGAIVNVTERTGQLLIAGGYAEEVATPTPAVMPPAGDVERAVDVKAEARRTATGPAQRRRK